jgi:uncharacterized protein
VLGFGGWADLFQDGMARNHQAIPERSHMVYGPWGHQTVFNATVTLGTLLAFFDRHLHQLEHVPPPPDRFATFEMPAGPWREFGTWPPASTGDVTLALTTSGGLHPDPGPQGAASYIAAPSSRDVADPQRRDRVSFLTDPVAEPAVLTGDGQLGLTATLHPPAGVTLPPQAVDTNVVVEVYDVGPGGGERLVTTGYLKASHRSGHDAAEILPAGEPIELAIPLWHVHWRLEAGDRLRVEIKADGGSCCFASATQAAPTAADVVVPLTVELATGMGGSTLTLPVLGLSAGCEKLGDPREPCRDAPPW